MLYIVLAGKKTHMNVRVYVQTANLVVMCCLFVMLSFECDCCENGISSVLYG